MTAAFDDVRLTFDIGVSLLHRIDKRLGLSDRLAAAMIDRRDPLRVRHSLRDLLMQRIALICAGYEDANDATTLRHDPAFQLALGRVPGEAALASQPTLSRFEQRPRRDLLS
ncbi:MAG TPA: transposase, partial [Thermoanaerobaculia bacterium]|nr:transposase [Thermoanaerobaculia bacterium]